MIRYSLLWLYISGMIGYAWKVDWCKALCALVLLLGVMERPDMPKSIFGIQGLNPFNVALLGILAAWAADPERRTRPWDVPRWLTVLFSIYIGVMLLSTMRMLLNPAFLLVWQHEMFEVTSRGALVSEYLLNTFKWVIPAVLLVQGCRGEERHRLVVLGALGMYVVLAILVIRQMPLGYLLDGEGLQQRAADILQRRVGYHRVDLATVFAGASWALLAARPLFTSRLYRLGLVGMWGVTTLGLALTGGRMGYAAWCIVGFILSTLKWRRYLLVIPVAIALVFTFAPAIPDRMLQGFSGSSIADQHLVTSGRNQIWPFVMRAIGDQPIVGYGRQAWARTGLRLEAAFAAGEAFGHPHNAYLEFALDNGIVGLAVVLLLFGTIVWHSARLFLNRSDPVVTAAGGMALAMSLAYVIAAAGAQTFYPTESAVGMWCLIALAIRVGRERVAAARDVPVDGPDLQRSAATPVSVPPRVHSPGALWPEALRQEALGQRLPARDLLS